MNFRLAELNDGEVFRDVFSSMGWKKRRKNVFALTKVSGDITADLSLMYSRSSHLAERYSADFSIRYYSRNWKSVAKRRLPALKAGQVGILLPGFYSYPFSFGNDNPKGMAPLRLLKNDSEIDTERIESFCKTSEHLLEEFTVENYWREYLSEFPKRQLRETAAGVLGYFLSADLSEQAATYYASLQEQCDLTSVKIKDGQWDLLNSVASVFDFPVTWSA